MFGNLVRILHKGKGKEKEVTMFNIFIMDKDAKRGEVLKQALMPRFGDVNLINNEDIDHLKQPLSGLLLVLDSQSSDVEEILSKSKHEHILIILTNSSLDLESHLYDHLFYLAKTDTEELIIKQIHALADVIEDQQLLPIFCDTKTKSIYQMLRKVSPSYAPIFINGETGTGKEVIARFVHHHSLAKNGPFVAVNCAALPETMIESILFGYEKGAFTGALTTHIGKFEQADNGTLFLDEVSELPLSLQAKILRALQQKEIERLGGKKSIKINTRIISATNRKLNELMNESQFRKDLYYRLCVVPINCLPLRERLDDILPLAEYFLTKYAYQLGIKKPSFSEEIKQKLLHYSWPGNVRELENIIYRSILLAEYSVINTLDGMEEEVSTSAHGFKSKIEEYEAKAIIETLKANDGKRNVAAKILKMSDRALRYKLAKLKENGVVVP